MRLHPVTHGPNKNRFCGPAALSALTGLTTDETSRTMRELLHRRAITGTDLAEMLICLNHYGFSTKQHSGYINLPKPTLALWLRTHKREPGVVYLISAGNHWQLVAGRSFVCGLTREVVDLKHPKVRRRARVRLVWEITR